MEESSFSERMKRVREELTHLNQSDFGALLAIEGRKGLGKRRIQQLESGKITPEAKTLAKYMRRLDEIEQQYSQPRRPKPHDQSIPFYDVDVSASNIQMFDDKHELATDYYKIKGFEDCDFAVPVFGHSMYPTYENGIIILCKPIHDKDLIAYGECHLIITKEQRLVKRVLKSEKDEMILAVSDNEETRKDGKKKYDSFEIPKDKIVRLYLIKGCVKRNQI